mmetsp:Transcript_107711/g.322184  ORF Transcript_107711/g.322184 Transcript_107711/m.322184 type:complete len:556 (+) Transcript_107711:187-1854(+)
MEKVGDPWSDLPLAVGGEVKWFVWNTIWHTLNSGLAVAWSGEPSADKSRAAQEDAQRTAKHFEAARKTGSLSVTTLNLIKEQAILAGQAAIKAVLSFRSMDSDKIEALDPPSQMQASLWSRLVRAVRLAAASISETSMAVSHETFFHWHKGQALEKEFERAWSEVYEQPPYPPPREVERTVPPRPITIEWLQQYGGLTSEVPRAVREEPFTDLDEGMVSSCRLLWLRPAAGGPEECYVVKRSVGGVTAHWTAGSLVTEYRFYDKVVRKGAWPRAAELLAKALHVPKLLVANLGPQEQETHGFLLVMERLTAPQWTRVDPREGCSQEQAVAAVEALGRMHGLFADDGELGALPFLGVKPLGSEGQFEGGFALCFMRSLGELQKHLSPAAMAACGRMMRGSVGRVLKQLTQPPLTMLHGDFKLENLRFAGSKIGAFDWGLVTRGRGAWDFAYFLVHGIRPERRRQLDRELVRAYLWHRQRILAEAKGGTFVAVTEALCQKFEHEVRSALLCILGKLVIVLADYQGSEQLRQMLQRNVKWAGAAVEDWRAVQALDMLG